MKLGQLSRIEGSARRIAEIVAVLGKYGLADWLSKLDYPWLRGFFKSAHGEPLPGLTTEERLRLALTDLGTCFIKLGQMLSTRPDLISPELVEELAKLRANTPADPAEQVRLTIQQELGQPPEALFREFSIEPMASASIGQVHRAVLRSGEEAVVKVMHTGIEATLTRDLDILMGLAELAERHAPGLRAYQPVATARFFQRSLLREIDFHHERRHLEEFSRNFAFDRTVEFPAVFADFCGRRVLTMKFLRGVSVSDAEGLRAAKFDLDEAARRGANVYLEMIFRDGFYHADPHPGNLLLLESGVIGVVDAGMVGRIDKQLREDLQAMLLAAVQGDAEELTDLLVRVGHAPPSLDREALRTEISEFLADYVGQSLAEFDLSGALNRLIDAIRRFHIALPPGLAMLLKTLVLLEGTSRQVSPKFSLAELLGPFCAKASWRKIDPRGIARDAQRRFRDWRRLLDLFPRDAAEVLSRIRQGSFEVHLEHRRLEGTVDRLVTGLLVAALFVGSSMMLSANVPPLFRGVSLSGGLGCGMAAALGWRLLVAIRKSAKDRGDRPP